VSTDRVLIGVLLDCVAVWGDGARTDTAPDKASPGPAAEKS
jgi:hypothetical protein